MIKAIWLNGYEDISDAHMIRQKVFIEEQGTPWEIEMDDLDTLAMHLVIYENDVPVATGRVIWDEGECIIGRLAVLKEHRGKKYGDFAMRLMIRRAYDSGAKRQHIHAQIQAKGFYEKLGFKACGEEYLEADIPHIDMFRDGDIF